MMINNIKLICTDIDGTLINDKDQLPDNFDWLIDKLEERGIAFVAASGRGAASIESKLENDSDNIYVISDNGAQLHHHGEIVYKNSFSKSQLKEIIEVFRKTTEATIIVTGERMSYAELHPDHSEEFLKEFFVEYTIVEDVTKYDGITKISLKSDFNTVKNLKLPEMQALEKKYHLVQTADIFTDIMHAESNKGNALEKLLEILKIDMDETIGFGDFLNDIHMLEVVGKSYAMKNAHPKVKEIADEIIGSNNDNSVINKIIELLKLT